MKAFLSSIAVATVGEKDKIRGQNVKIAGKRTSQDEFNILPIKRRKAIMF